MKHAIFHFALIPVLSFAPLSFAQISSQTLRSAGFGLSYGASRAWDEYSSDSSKTDSARLSGSYLFLGQHFHLGPVASIGRYYSGSYSSTSYGLGVIGKWTLEDLRLTKQTPFMGIRTEISRSTGSQDQKSEYQDISLSAGYEYFVNDFVSLSNALRGTRSWTKTRSKSVFDDMKYTSKSNGLNVGLELIISIYL